jgi:ribosomal protein L24E
MRLLVNLFERITGRSVDCSFCGGCIHPGMALYLVIREQKTIGRCCSMECVGETLKEKVAA